MMTQNEPDRQFLLCVNNESYPASLELRKVYRALPDPSAAAKCFVRVVDESGEDYLYPSAYILAIELPVAALSAFVAAP